MPMIESTYKVSKKADDRAIAGLSMGGGQTMNIAFNRPELFRYVVMMSPAAPRTPNSISGRVQGSVALNKQFKLFWMAVGKDDTLTGPGDRDADEGASNRPASSTSSSSPTAVTSGRCGGTTCNEVAPLLFK